MELMLVIVGMAVATLALFALAAIGLLGPAGTRLGANTLRIGFFVCAWAAIAYGIAKAWM